MDQLNPESGLHFLEGMALAVLGLVAVVGSALDGVAWAPLILGVAITGIGAVMCVGAVASDQGVP